MQRDDQRKLEKNAQEEKARDQRREDARRQRDPDPRYDNRQMERGGRRGYETR